MRGIATQLKLFFVALAAIVILVVTFQNMETVETRILFVSMEMPRAVLLAATFLIGFAVGVITTTWITRKRDRKAAPPQKQPAPEQDSP